jgi:hypothetical protein
VGPPGQSRSRLLLSVTPTHACSRDYLSLISGPEMSGASSLPIFRIRRVAPFNRSRACRGRAHATDSVESALAGYKPLSRFASFPVRTPSSLLAVPFPCCRGKPPVTPGFRRQTECEPCTCQDQLFTYTAVT